MYLFSLIYRQILQNIMYNIQVRSNEGLECNYVYICTVNFEGWMWKCSICFYNWYSTIPPLFCLPSCISILYIVTYFE